MTKEQKETFIRDNCIYTHASNCVRTPNTQSVCSCGAGDRNKSHVIKLVKSLIAVRE